MTTNQQDFYQLNLAYLHAARESARSYGDFWCMGR